MLDVVERIFLHADYIILLFFRIGALTISSPIFGRVNIPSSAKICLMTTLTYFFFLVLPTNDSIEYVSLLQYALLILNEVVVGMALAFVMNAFFAVTATAGQLIDMQMGFGMANIYDMQSNSQMALTATMLNVIMILVFFGVNGHQQLIGVIKTTIEKLPVGTLVFSPDIGLVAAEVFAKSFMLGIVVALPFIASGLILEFSFGMLIRTVPQMNMFVVGIPLKTFVGFVVLLTSIPVFVHYSETIFAEMFIAIDNIFAVFLA